MRRRAAGRAPDPTQSRKGGFPSKRGTTAEGCKGTAERLFWVPPKTANGLLPPYGTPAADAAPVPAVPIPEHRRSSSVGFTGPVLPVFWRMFFVSGAFAFGFVLTVRRAFQLSMRSADGSAYVSHHSFGLFQGRELRNLAFFARSG